MLQVKHCFNSLVFIQLFADCIYLTDEGQNFKDLFLSKRLI